MLRNQILTSLSNAVIGGAGGLLAYVIGRRVWSARVGLIGAWLCWTSSALILIDAHSMRDTIGTFSTLIIVYGAYRLGKHLDLKSAVWFIVGLGVQLQIRGYVAIVDVAAAFVGIILMARRHRLALALIMIAAGVVAGYVVAASDVVHTLEKLGNGNIIRDLIKFGHGGLAEGRQISSAAAHFHIHTIGAMVKYVPVGMVRFLFGPLAWKTGGVDRFIIPDIVVRWLIGPLSMIGLYDSLRHHWNDTVLVVVVFVAGIVLYSFIELGALARHNCEFFPYEYLLAAYGWTVAHEYRVTLGILYAVLSLAIWAYGIGFTLAVVSLPLIVVLLVGVWYLGMRVHNSALRGVAR